MRDNLPWRIEETCFNAFPSLKQVLFGDWLLRLSPGVSRRSNSVNPLRCDPTDIAGAIALAEIIYPAQGLPPIFRIPSVVSPELDAALAANGFTTEGETCVLHGALDRVAAAADPAVRLLVAPDDVWLRAMAALQGFSAAQRKTYRGIVGAIAVPARFALIEIAGKPAALAYGAIHDRLLCYESVITDAACRRQGLARRVIASLAGWARSAGAKGVCLQVQADNTPARALYAGLGLAELYRYHYRRSATGG